MGGDVLAAPRSPAPERTFRPGCKRHPTGNPRRGTDRGVGVDRDGLADTVFPHSKAATRSFSTCPPQLEDPRHHTFS